MVNDMKKKERLKYIRIVLLFLIFLAVFFPWMCMGNESFTILEFYRKITANDVLTETVQNGAILQLLPYFLIFPVGCLLSVGDKSSASYFGNPFESAREGDIRGRACVYRYLFCVSRVYALSDSVGCCASCFCGIHDQSLCFGL